MSNTSSAVKRRYNQKAYDTMFISVPKGWKQKIQDYASENGISVNSMLCALIRAEMGVSEADWKRIAEAAEGAPEGC